MMEDQRPRYGIADNEITEKCANCGASTPFNSTATARENRLERWANIAQLISIGPILFAVGAYLVSLQGASERARETSEAAKAQQRSAHYEAWQVISAAHGKGGSGGRVEALNYLNSERVLLIGVDLSYAELNGVNLRHASLGHANLDSAWMQGADLRNADLSYSRARGVTLAYATLDSVNMEGSDLRGAFFGYSSGRKADFRYANLRGASLSPSGPIYNSDFLGADLRHAHLNVIDWDAWRHVADLRMANVFGVEGVSKAWVRWAVDSMGAVSLKSDSAWEERRQKFFRRAYQIDEACRQTVHNPQAFRACRFSAAASDSIYAILVRRLGMLPQR